MTKKKRVLVVDDERDILDLLRYNLQREGYEVLTAQNGEEALAKASTRPDLILLDVMMPVLDGLETCKRLKSAPATARIPIIFLTARSAELDEVLGLELGAEDYVQKPISQRRLMARVKVVLRRHDAGTTGTEEPTIRAGIVEVDPETFTVRVRRREIFFPRKEFGILALLAGHPGKVYSREAILDRVWGGDVVVTDRTVDVHVRKIREKLGDDASLIETLKGVGYRFAAAKEER
jgi:two-component system, OmpR family, alkaline phosphatase synthesis response regulator PhoP